MTGAKILLLSPMFRDDAMLFSPQQGTPWPDARVKADGPPSGSFEPRGIHAYRNLRIAVSSNDVAAPVAFAICRPEGDTIIGENGWTAEAARIIRIFLARAQYAQYARSLYARYRVPVTPLPRSLEQKQYRPWAGGNFNAWNQESDRVPGRTPAGREWIRLRMPGAAIQRYNDAGTLEFDKKTGARIRIYWCFRGIGYGIYGNVPCLYDPVFAARQAEFEPLRIAREEKERQERWAREKAEREAKARAERARIAADQAKALEILRPYLPIRTARISSASARGAAKQYSYWGVAKYEIRATADGKAVSNICVSGASSDRRSQRLVQQDLAEVCKREKRFAINMIGRLDSVQASAIANRYEALKGSAFDPR